MLTQWTRWIVTASVIAAPWIAPAGASGEGAAVREPAPEFTHDDTNGQPHDLKDLRGKYVVLEWFNPECPFVRKHYGSGNMQQTQKDATARGVVWLSIDSSAPGKQGSVTPEQANAFMQEQKAAPTAVLLDADGSLGKTYGAKTTPHLFVINPEGVVIYNGAIDDKPSTDQADVAGAKNLVKAALDEAMSGKPVTTASTQPYGCSVKY